MPAVRGDGGLCPPPNNLNLMPLPACVSGIMLCGAWLRYACRLMKVKDVAEKLLTTAALQSYKLSTSRRFHAQAKCFLAASLLA